MVKLKNTPNKTALKIHWHNTSWHINTWTVEARPQPLINLANFIFPKQGYRQFSLSEHPASKLPECKWVMEMQHHPQKTIAIAIKTSVIVRLLSSLLLKYVLESLCQWNDKSILEYAQRISSLTSIPAHSHWYEVKWPLNQIHSICLLCNMPHQSSPAQAIPFNSQDLQEDWEAEYIYYVL